MSVVVTPVLSFRWRKSAVSALVPLGVTEVGLAFRDRTSHGLKLSVAGGLPAPEPLRIAVSQGAALGPLLHPHQLLLATTLPGPPLSTRRPPPTPPPPGLPTMRARLTLRVPPPKMPPPPVLRDAP